MKSSILLILMLIKVLSNHCNNFFILMSNLYSHREIIQHKKIPQIMLLVTLYGK